MVNDVAVIGRARGKEHAIVVDHRESLIGELFQRLAARRLNVDIDKFNPGEGITRGEAQAGQKRKGAFADTAFGICKNCGPSSRSLTDLMRSHRWRGTPIKMQHLGRAIPRYENILLLFISTIRCISLF